MTAATDTPRRRVSVDLDVFQPVILEAPTRPRRPFIDDELLNWHTAPTAPQGVVLTGSDLPPYDGGERRRQRRAVGTAHVSAIDDLTVSAGNLVEPVELGVEDAQRSPEVASTVIRAAWSTPILRRYQHIGSHRGSTGLVTRVRTISPVKAVIAFIAVAWPVYAAIVWVVNT